MSALLGINGDTTSLGPGPTLDSGDKSGSSSLRNGSSPVPGPARTLLWAVDPSVKERPTPARPTCCLASIGRRMSATCRDSRFHRSSLSLWHCCRTRINISSTCGRGGCHSSPLARQRGGGGGQG